MTKTKLDNENDFKEQFFNVLNNDRIKTVFQPIISLRDGSLYGYEALSRGPQNSEMHTPNMLFECAALYGKSWELDSLCRAKAIERACELNVQDRLFINVSPNIMHDTKFKQGFTKEYLNRYAFNPENIIFEITEKEAVNNIADFMNTIQNYKKQNYKIAIDDAGAGYSGLNMISDIHPHFIKLDMNLIRDVDKDITKQLLIKSLSDFASLTNTFLIAEGIETENELLELINIGIHYGQGFFIQRPDSSTKPIDGQVVQIIKDANQKKNHLGDKKLSDIYICNICRTIKTTDADIPIAEIYDTMKEDPVLPGICITEDGYVIGVVTRDDLFKRLSGLYGYSLHFNKPIGSIMNKEFLRVDYHESIEAVANKAMNRDIEKIYDFITVTKEQKYYGIVTVKDLLMKSIQIEVNNAKHLNPLSELPGNFIIEKQLESCINSDIKYYFLYFDIDNFKAYNDVYGFENGDRFIKCLAKILEKNISKDDFIGHIGGDDFIAIISGNNAEQLCAAIIADVDQSVALFYNQNDINRGYIITKNRHGKEEKFPLLTVSIAGAPSDKFPTIYALSENIAALKAMCKQKQGSNYLLT
jgi:EAL domain-containing protein (putative c-di-GMP-specific phosphodiesterase class I)/GGDEF domain-containing protein